MVEIGARHAQCFHRQVLSEAEKQLLILSPIKGKSEAEGRDPGDGFMQLCWDRLVRFSVFCVESIMSLGRLRS